MTITAKPPRQPVNTRRRILVAGPIILLIGLSVALLAPSFTSVKSDQLSGGILLWHSLADSDAESLAKATAEFEQLHPQVTVHQQSFPAREELIEQYRESVASGLGPDLFLGDAAWISELAKDGGVRAITDDVSSDLTDEYLPTAIASLSIDNELYGLPLSLHVPALYYNTKLVEKPPVSLDGLLTQAADGHTVLMSTNFRDSFWGIQAFGGKFLDEEGRVILDQGGYANWLDWLMTARIAPGMILDSSRESLQERFLQGDASYYIGYPEEVERLIDGLGDGGIGVVPLPSGPTGSAGPLLSVDAFLFSPVSSQNQREISLELAKFATNAEQSANFMRKGREIPANTNVRINPRLHPLVAGFLAQARSALALPNTDTMDASWSIANTAYKGVLNGLSTPIEAAAETTAAINELNGFPATVRNETVCTDLGTLRLVHDWDGDDAEALDEIIRRFKAVCPLVIVNAVYDDLDTVTAKWKRNPRAVTNPDLILASQEWLIDSLKDEIPLKDIGGLVEGDTLQRYLPAALTGMRVENRLLGLPASVQVHVLFYNRQLIEDPAQVLEQIYLQADNGLPITLEAQFVPSYWGVGAFGGRLLDENNRPALDAGGFADWLTWLRDARDEHGIMLTLNSGESRELFIDGASAYYVGEPGEIDSLSADLGAENLGVGLLPSGPEGASTPLFLASGLYFNDALNDAELSMALDFALFFTNAENQQLLVDQTSKVPANATVDLTEQPHIVTVVEQSRTAYPLPNCINVREALETGNQAYSDVLDSGRDPEEAASDANARMTEICGEVIDSASDQDISNGDEIVSPSPTVEPTIAPAETPAVELELQKDQDNEVVEPESDSVE